MAKQKDSNETTFVAASEVDKATPAASDYTESGAVETLDPQHGVGSASLRERIGRLREKISPWRTGVAGETLDPLFGAGSALLRERIDRLRERIRPWRTGVAGLVRSSSCWLSSYLAFLLPILANVGSYFVSRSGGLTVLTLIPLAYFSYILGNGAYENLQRHYQKAFLTSTANVDVIKQICNSRSDILWENCLNPGNLDIPSERLIWVLLVSADIIDPLNVPTPSQLEDLQSKDPAAAIVYRWLMKDWGDSTPPHRSRGVGLLLDTATLCTTSATAHKDSAMKTLVTSYLSAVYTPMHDSTKWLSPEFKRALGLSSTSGNRSTQFPTEPEDAQEWLAPSDPRAVVTSNGGDLLSEDRAEVWAELDEKVRFTPKLDEFLKASKSRLAVASHVGDDDLVAMLFAYGTLIDTQTGQFRSDFSDCERLERVFVETGGGGSANDLRLYQTTLANFEKLALYVAGQIRVSPDAKKARFWVSIYTGHEQRLILTLGAFGFLVVVIKIAIFAGLNLAALRSSERPSLSPFESPAFVPEERDNEFDGLASSRWVMKIPIALIPAIGFIGTVRGIMLSLSGADAIVWAETVNERSSAISDLSADLGLAFATTLLALLVGALLTFLSLSEMALGERLLLRRYSKQ